MPENQDPEAQAFTDTYDAKMLRTQTLQERPLFCPECGLFRGHHKLNCASASPLDYERCVRQAREDEDWARKRAAHWLGEVQKMHGKMAQLKHEVRVLRQRCRELELTVDTLRPREVGERTAVPVLGSPDRPGKWYWRRDSEAVWEQVFVGLKEGDGLVCFSHGQDDRRGWSGDWMLKQQYGPRVVSVD